jgi:SAM-dependent methyltransferase
MRSQGLLPFVQKAWRAGWTEAERRLPPLRRGSVFVCPCCESREQFVSYRGRPYAVCPGCGAKERDRLLALILRDLLERLGPRTVLHAAPEVTIRPLLADCVSSYFVVDLTRGLSSYAGQLSAAADLTRLPFADDSFDLVLASHVLEHIPDDRAAIREVHRVLKPGGTAILPVPIVHGGATVEYGEPRADEEMHVRAPGLDYFDRFEEGGFQVVARRSSDFSTSHQLRSFHSHWDDIGRAPSAKPGRPGLAGMEQYVPVCTKTARLVERVDSSPAAREHA